MLPTTSPIYHKRARRAFYLQDPSLVSGDLVLTPDGTKIGYFQGMSTSAINEKGEVTAKISGAFELFEAPAEGSNSIVAKVVSPELKQRILAAKALPREVKLEGQSIPVSASFQGHVATNEEWWVENHSMPIPLEHYRREWNQAVEFERNRQPVVYHSRKPGTSGIFTELYGY